MDDGVRLHVRVEYQGGSTGTPGELECDIDIKKPAEVALKQVSLPQPPAQTPSYHLLYNRITSSPLHISIPLYLYNVSVISFTSLRVKQITPQRTMNIMENSLVPQQC